MAQDYKAIAAFAQGESGEIGGPLALPRSDIWRVTQFRSNSAVSKMFALMLSSRDPLDIITGQRIEARKSLSWNNDKEFHHFFPRDFLKGLGVTSGQANAVANIVLLSSASNIKITNEAPSKYLAAAIGEVGRDEVERRLASLLVSPDVLDAALRDDYDGFLRLRADLIHQEALRLVGEVDDNDEKVTAEVVGEVFVDDAAVPDEATESNIGD